MKKTAQPYPILKSDRLILKIPQASNIPDIIQYANNVNISNNLISLPHPYAEKDAIFWLNMAHQGFQNKENYIFGIHLDKNKFIGGIGLHTHARDNHAELGYWIGEPHWNKGIVTEAVAIMLKFGFEALKLERIYAVHFEDNPASGKVMIKNGMQHEGVLRNHVKKGEKYRSIVQYAILKETYLRP